MNRDAMLACLEAQRAVLQGAVAQTEALIATVISEGEEAGDGDPEETCPRCGSTDIADAGDGQRACGKCASGGVSTVFGGSSVTTAFGGSKTNG
jgi:hypothetical protein